MIRQRFLYIGIGGSGLDIGRELSDALTKEICGLDGRRLVARSGSFAGFDRGQLPGFIQSLYLDFSSSALDEIKTHLKGKNATAATNIMPPHNSYIEACRYLKNNTVPGVDEWIPPETESVNVAPLKSGAGQYPNVGRVAMMAAMRSSGYAQTIGQQLGGAIDRLGQSLGQLTSYAGDVAHANSVAVYIGFSLSGGTGCGIFYDVIHLLYNELVTKMPEVSCTIMPIIIMPSLFDGTLSGVNKRNAQLNAAIALLDLSRLMDLFNSPDPALALERRVTYPWTSTDSASQYKQIDLNAQTGHTSVKVATLVGKGGGLERKDVYRSIASAIVSQVSTVAEYEQQTMGFIDKLVNDNEIRDPHHTLLGRKNIMPTVSASLTLPSERLTDLISRKILADGLSAQFAALPNRALTEEDAKVFLSGSGQADLVKPRTFEAEVGLTIKLPPVAGQRKRAFDQSKVKLNSAIASAKAQILKKIRSRIFEIKEFKVYDGIKFTLGSLSDRTLPEAIQIGRKSASMLSSPGTSAPPAKLSVKENRAWSVIFNRRPNAGDLQRWLDAQRKLFTADIQNEWWTLWANSKSQWDSSVEEGSKVFNLLDDVLKKLAEDAEDALKREVVQLQQPSLGVVEFLPSDAGDMGQTVELMVREVKAKLRARLNLIVEDDASLVSALMRRDEQNYWNTALTVMERTSDKGRFVETLLDPVREEVQTQLAEILPSLGDLLKRLAEADAGSLPQDLDQLRATLAALLPNGVIPNIEGGKPRVLVTYPGNRDLSVQTMIQNFVFQDRFSGHADIAKDIFQWAANPDGNSLTATINVVGQGLLDSAEVRELMSLWISANEQSAMTDRLHWRQRVGYRNLRDLTDNAGRRLILRHFLGALYDGHISIIAGDLNSPEVLRIRKESTDAYMDVRLTSVHGASPWASLFTSFEKAVVQSGTGSDADVPNVIKWFGTYSPKCLKAVEDFTKPDNIGAIAPSALFEEFMCIVESRVSKPAISEISAGLAEDAILYHRAVHKFWERDVPEALLAPHLQSGLSFWCIAGAYAISGASEKMKSELNPKIIARDADVHRRIKEEEERRAAVFHAI